MPHRCPWSLASHCPFLGTTAAVALFQIVPETGIVRETGIVPVVVAAETAVQNARVVVETSAVAAAVVQTVRVVEIVRAAGIAWVVVVETVLDVETDRAVAADILPKHCHSYCRLGTNHHWGRRAAAAVHKIATGKAPPLATWHRDSKPQHYKSWKIVPQ